MLLLGEVVLVFGFFIGLKGVEVRVVECLPCAALGTFGDSKAADRRGIVSVICDVRA